MSDGTTTENDVADPHPSPAEGYNNIPAESAPQRTMDVEANNLRPRWQNAAAQA